MLAPTSSDDIAPAPSRKSQTDCDYAKGGQQLLNRAMRQYPNASDVVDAFILLCDDPKWVLRSSTTRTYKARIIKRIEIEVTAGQCDPDRAIEGIEKITKLLDRRRGNPKARTSRLKCMDVRPEEVQLISDDLRSRLAADNPDEADSPDEIDEVLLGYVELDPRYGLRPCEWERARIIETTLVVLNAKYSDHRAPGLDRRIPLEHEPKRLVLGVAALIGMIRTLIEQHGSWERVHDILAERTYGARRVWHDLLAEGVSCGLHRIERLMRSQGLKARPRRRRLPPDLGERQTAAVAPNVLDRSFQAPAANRKWIADFTYVWTAEGWLYVAAVIDLFSRRVVGWSMNAAMTAQLVTDALVMAIWRRVEPDALLHHSDRGSQYSSEQFQRLITASSAR